MGREIKTFRSKYRSDVNWFNRQSSFELLYERIAREKYTKGMARIEGIANEYIEAYKENALYHYLYDARLINDGLPREEHEKRYEFCRDTVLEISKHRLISKDVAYIAEQLEKSSQRLSQASYLLRETIHGCYFSNMDYRKKFEGVTFDVFLKLNRLCNMFAEYVNRFKCNGSGELPDDGSLYFTDILKPLYEKCNGTIFESAEMRDYLEILNICIANKTLKIKKQKTQILFILTRFTSTYISMQ